MRVENLQRRLHRVLLTLAFTILITSTVISGIPKMTGGQEIPYGGTLRIGWIGDLDTLNPMLAWSGWDLSFYLAMYESLLWWDTSLRPMPWLAEKYESSSDGLSWTFHLVRNATWHDGKPFTSADVKFTYEFLKNGKFPWGGSSSVQDVMSVDAPDDYTVVLHTATPLATMTTVIAMVSILPKHIWETMTRDQVMEFKNENPIGTGPFKFSEWKTGEYAKVVVNENYWKGRPYIDAVIFKHYDSMDAVVLGLRAGEIDTVGISTLFPPVVKELEQDPQIKVVASTHLRWNYIGFNCNETGTGNPTLRDSKVRLALRYTVDKDTYVRLAFLGYATPGVAHIPPSMPYWFNPNLKNEYNMTKAAQILTEAGYIDRNKDGIRESPAGIKMEYNLYTYTASEEVRIAPLWAQSLASLGIKVIVQVLEEGALGAIVYTYKHDIDMWVWDLNPDPDYAMELFVTNNPAQSEMWSNATYDRLYNEQKAALDPEARKQIIWKMQEILFEQSPNIITSYPDIIQAYRTDTFTGYVRMPAGIGGGWLNVHTYLNIHLLPTVATTTPTMTTSTTTQAPPTSDAWILAGVSLIIAIVAVAYAVMVRRRKPSA